MRFVFFFFDGAFGFVFLGALEDVFSVRIFLRTIGLGEMSNLRTGFLVREDLRQPRSDSGSRSVSFTDTVDADVGVPLRGVIHTSYT